MTTEEKPIPPPCSQDIYQNGTPVFRTDTIHSFDLEPWVQKVAALSGQPVDWHFAGGRAIVLALGDLEKVRAALRELLPEHDALWRAACGDIFGEKQKADYLASMREYAGLGEAPAEIGTTGIEEREKFIVRIK